MRCPRRQFHFSSLLVSTQYTLPAAAALHCALLLPLVDRLAYLSPVFSKSARRVMSDRGKALGTPRRPSSPASGGERRERDPLEGDAKRRKASRDSCNTQPPAAGASQPRVAGPSHVNDTAVSPSSEGKLDQLSTLLNALIDKLDKPTAHPVSSGADYSGFLDFSPSDDEAAEASRVCPSLIRLTTSTGSPPHSQPVILWLIPTSRMLLMSLMASSMVRKKRVTLYLIVWLAFLMQVSDVGLPMTATLAFP
ncbi:uncharacterized protein LOC135106689 [Scylla paramamosain]|uniref:uncharacterized protein LOC135106689 n=1 Tax=Scylla paramamosain TaxID=85552 RepID=UPI003083654F